MTDVENLRRQAVMDASFAIVAVAANRVIGMNGAIPWHHGQDMKHFKHATMGCALVVGRTTFDSLPRRMPGRTVIVVTSRPLPEGTAAIAAASFGEAVRIAIEDAGVPAIAFAGGLGIYAAAMELPWMRKALVTRIELAPPGDTFLPELGAEWTVGSTDVLACSEDEPEAAVLTMVRAAASA